MDKKLHRFSKKALAVLLTAALILTILSRALNALTIPAVKVSSYKSGVIEYEAGGTGMVEAEEVRSVEIIAGQRIGRLAAFPGKAVTAGEDLFFYQLEGLLECYDKELIELERLEISLSQEQIGSRILPVMSKAELAGQSLDKSQKNYEKARASWEDAQTDYQRKIASLEQEFEADKKKTAEQLLKKRYEEWQSAERTYEMAVLNEEEAVKKAKWDLADAEQKLQYLEDDEADEKSIADAKALVKRRRQELYLTEDKWYLTVDQANADRQARRKAYEAMLNGSDDGLDALEKEYEEAVNAEKKSLEIERDKFDAAADDLADARLDLENALINDSYSGVAEQQKQELAALRRRLIELSIAEKQEEIAKLTRLIEQQGAVKAPLDGTVMNLGLTAGQLTNGQEQVEIGIGGLVLKGTVSKQMAKYISHGDSLVLKKDGLVLRELEGRAESVVAGSDGGDYSLTARLTGSGAGIGSQLSFQVTSQSSRYDMVIPLSALREDNQATYILFAEEKATILGTEMVARRLDVTLLAKNAVYAAVSGSLSRDMPIISDSSRFIQEGDRIRVITE